MKKLKTNLSLLLLLFSVQSCTTSKVLMSEQEIAEKGYSTKAYSIYKKGCVVARVSSVEWEIYQGNIVQEISVTIDVNANPNITKDLLRYLQTKNPNSKIEVNVDPFDYYK